MPSQRVEIPLPFAHATTRSKFVSSQALVNCYAEAAGDMRAIYGGPGLEEFADIGTGPIRGEYDFNGSLLAVSGDTLYTVDANGDETAVGAIAGYDPVIISSNTTQATIVSDSTSYVWDGTTLAPLNDSDFRRSSSIDFLKQTMISSVYNSSSFQTSAIADAESYDALDIATAEAKPDKLRRGITIGGEWLAFGEKSVEGYYYSGKPNGVPLSPTQTYLEYGLAGRDAFWIADNSVHWLSHILDVRSLREGASVIADPAITALIQSWTDPGSARGFSFQFGGHEFGGLRHAQGCVIYDHSTRLWHTRQSFGMDTWRVASSVWCYNKNIMGDATNGKLWTLSPDVYAEGSDPLVRQLATATLGPGGLPFTLDKVELEVGVGVGLATGQGSDPKIWMQLSRDGGHTWGARLERSMGLMGKRLTRVIWQGPFGDFLPHGGVIRFGVSDPVQLVATKMWAEFTPNRP